MIRLIILFILSEMILPLPAMAQTPLDNTAMWHARPAAFARLHTFGAGFQPAKKWQLNTYSGISAGYGVLNRTSALFMSAPVTMQLTHPINRNLYAFAQVSAAPGYNNFNTFLLQPRVDKYSQPNWMSGAHPFGWTLTAAAGLFYINDEKTFSISGSIFVDRSSYPAYIPLVPQRPAFMSR